VGAGDIWRNWKQSISRHCEFSTPATIATIEILQAVRQRHGGGLHAGTKDNLDVLINLFTTINALDAHPPLVQGLHTASNSI
jgi:hypothetical protein